MMPNEVELGVVTKGDDGRAFDQASQRAEQLGTRMGRIRDIAQGILSADLIREIGTRAQQFLGQAANAASGLEQAVGGTEAVFGEASRTIDEFGQRSAKAVGLSEREFREATTLIGGQLKRMTGDVDLAAASSIQLVEVGADLAATYGGTTKEAVDAFAAALRGEADPAERFNLNLKVSAVNAKAVELGLAETTKQVDDNARAQALLALVMEQSADAQGQFARESDTAAVAQQRANAAWEDAQAKLGETLLPVMGKAAEAASVLFSIFDALPDPLQANIGLVAALSAGFLILAPRIVAARVAMQEMGLSMRTVATRGGGALIAITAIATAAAFLNDKVERSRIPTSKLAEDLARLAETGRVTGEVLQISGRDTDGFSETLRKAEIDAKGFFDKLNEGADFWLNSQNDLSASRGVIEDLDAALAEIAKTGGDGEAAFRAFVEQQGLTRQETNRLRELLPEFREEQQRANERIRDAAAAHDEATAAAREQVVALDELADTLQAQNDPMFAVIDANRELAERQRAYTEAVDEFGRHSPEAREALLGLTEAGFRAAAAAAEAADTFDGKLTPSQRAALRAAGLTEEQLKDLEKELRDNARQADRTRREFNDLAGDYNVNVHTHFSSSGTPPGPGAQPDIFLRAHGGVTGAETVSHAQGGGTRGGLTMVAESGPEILELPFGTRVVPAGQTQAMLAERAGQLQAVAAGHDEQLIGGRTMAVHLSVNLFVQGSILSERELVGVVRDEFLQGGFRGALQAAIEAAIQNEGGT